MNYIKKYYLYMLVLPIFCTTLNVQTYDAFDIMTFNIRRAGKEKKQSRLWKSRLPYVTQIINEKNPEIVCLQEAVAEQISDISQKCPYYTWVGNARGSSWFGLAKNEHVPIFYKKNNFILLAYGTFQINKPSLIKRKNEGLIPRICTWAKFEKSASKEMFYVYNVHLDNSYAKARYNGLQVVINDIQNRVERDTPIFLMGDFNTYLSSDILSLLKKVHLQDTKNKALSVVSSHTTHTSWGSGKSSYIDHILYRPGSAVISINNHEVVRNNYPVEPSDHNPVIITVRMHS